MQQIHIEGREPIAVPQGYHLVDRRSLQTWMVLSKAKWTHDGQMVRYPDLVYNEEFHGWDEVDNEFMDGRTVVPMMCYDIVAVHDVRAMQDKIPVIVESGTWEYYPTHGMLVLAGKKG